MAHRTAPLKPLGISVLGLLRERPMHPYEMFQLLSLRREERTLKLRRGSLYHAVDHLAKERFISIVSTEREGRRPERTTYELTERGLAELNARISDMLAIPAQEHPEFPVAIAEAHTLPRQPTIDLLERRIAFLRNELSDIDNRIELNRATDLPEMFWLDASYQHAVHTAEVNWLAQLIEKLQSAEMPWIEEIDQLHPQKPLNARNHIG